MNEYIFREYDIRGVVNKDFTDQVVQNIGRAFGTYIRRQGGTSIAVSGDIRPSTPKLINQLSKGIIETGIDVIELGIIPTPVNYYSMYHLSIDGAVQITGSHNPPEFNGFKITYNKAAFYGKNIQLLKKIIKNNDFEIGQGAIKKINILNKYLDTLKNKIQINTNLKAVIDCGNASACLVAPEIFKYHGIDTLELFSNVDGSFPNHHPDPTDDNNLIDLINEVKNGKYDFGVAFDGDADRVVAIDETGSIIRSDILMALFLPEIINKEGEPILFDVKCSQALTDMINKYGGKPIMWKTGHSFIKDKMKELDIKFAGEMSGHIFFADDYYGFDDAIYVSLRLAQLLSNSKSSLSEMVQLIPKYYSTPELRLECLDDKEKFKIASSANLYFEKNYSCSTVDGVRIMFDDGWGLVRASNTQPVIVCRFEAKTFDRMKEIKNEILDKLIEFGDIKIGN